MTSTQVKQSPERVSGAAGDPSLLFAEDLAFERNLRGE